MLALNKSDIEDITNGNHNRYVASQNKEELLRELAYRLLKATSDTSDIDDKLDDISNCLDNKATSDTSDIDDKLDDIRNCLDNIRNK